MVFAQDNVSFFDNEVLDKFRIPFGDWMRQVVFWTDQNMESFFDWIEWPFVVLFNFILEAKFTGFPWQADARADDPYFDFGFGLIEMDWWIVVFGISLIALLVRNARVAVFAAVALTICGMLGVNYWTETAKTIGMVLVAVVLCALIGIPLGIACGRIDAVWSVVRPTLDAMQVVHSFVYMLPFIFFYGIGEVSATMVTMVFALPPLVRLTNLGIRQVPEDVVEAARAFGAPERRVLTDVQLPLARTAIMTGLNQTLLLAFSMLGIAAIMAAGGLGKLLLNALANLDAAQAASSGLAFFLVAVVMDRISQPEGSDVGFTRRITSAWKNLRTPENLLPADGEIDVADETADRWEPLTGAERLGLPIAAVGAVLAIVSLFLEWTDAPLTTGYTRRDDAGLTFSSNGLDATGGSWFGYIIGFCAVLALLGALNTFLRPGRGSRLLTPDVALLCGGAMVGASVAFLLVNAAEATPVSKGPGVLIAVIGSLLVLGGATFASWKAPYGPHRPLPVGLQVGRLVGAGIAMLLVIVGSFFQWTVDQRGGTVITPEIQAQIDELKEEGANDPVKAAANAQLISNLVNSARTSDLIEFDGFDSDGPALAPWAWALGIAGLLLALPAAGMLGITDERVKRFFSALVGAAGFGVLAIATAWIGSLARATDPGFVSGLGVFLVGCGGFILFASVRSVLTEFFRKKIHNVSGASIAAAGDARDVIADGDDLVVTLDDTDRLMVGSETGARS